MTIKEFSEICECNPQTLRYYDRIGLLVPESTDSWTGYRHYEKEQALDFVKIKNLQEADFSIDEIRVLLTKTNEEVYKAFTEKIEAKEKQLEKIKRIQSSYLNEQNKMKETIFNFSKKLIDSVKSKESIKEFGITESEADDIVKMIEEGIEESIKELDTHNVNIDIPVSDEAFDYSKENAPTSVPGFKIVYEMGGWNHAADFINELPKTDPHKKYKVIIKTVKNPEADMPFAMMLTGLLCIRNKNGIQVECKVFASPDSENHIYFLESK